MSRVEEVRSSFSATHGERSTIVSNSSFHGSIEGAKPVSFFSARIPNLRSNVSIRVNLYKITNINTIPRACIMLSISFILQFSELIPLEQRV